MPSISPPLRLATWASVARATTIQEMLALTSKPDMLSFALGLPEASVGLVPGCGGTQLLARRVGPGRAAELIFTGRRVQAAEASSIGLVDVLVPEESARERALELAAEIASNSPVAVRAAKQALRNGSGLGLVAALDVEDAAWRTAAVSADRREGIAAFAEKRPPAWPSAVRPGPEEASGD